MTNDRRKLAQRAEEMRLEREQAAKRQRLFLTGAIVVVVIALISLGAWAVSSAGGDDPYKNQTYVRPANIGAKGAVTYANDTAKEPVKVVVYEDFQCPFCKQFEDSAGDFLKQSVVDGDITLEWHPLAVLNNVSKDEYSTRSLNAAACVLDSTDIKTYIAMHDLLFANQPDEQTKGLSNARLAALAKQAGAGDQKSCINARVFGPWTKKVSDDAISDGLRSTPTIAISGRKVSGAKGGAPSVAELKKAIAKARA